ncbi:MAG: diaminopimelate decarboxylase family protein [Promethearchaeota archaeon]
MNKSNKNALYGNRYVNIRENKLILGSFPVEDLAEQFGTPTFIFLLDKIRDNTQYIQSCFQSVFPKSRGFYSTKSNFLQPVVEIMKSEQFGAEIIGLPELRLLKKIDFPLRNVLGGGPYLPDEFLTALIENKTEYLVIYDLDDLERVNKKAAQILERPQKILIRFRAPKYTGRHGVAFDPENIQKLSQQLQQCPFIQYKGILSHMGTRMKSLVNYKKNIDFVIQVLNSIKVNTALESEIINIGGGFPNADSMKKKAFTAILQEIHTDLKEAGWDHCEVFYEPGRFIVGDAGFCVARVYKYNPRFTTVFLDVGNNLIPKFMKASLRFYNASRITDSTNHPVDFMGNVPSDQDILIKNYNFTPNVKANDIILIANVGAYALTWSTRFPYPLPGIIFLKKDAKIIMHERSSDIDFTLL